MYSGNSSRGSSLEPTPGEQDLERRRQQAAGDSGTPPFSARTYELLALLIATIGFVGLCNNLLVLVVYTKFKRLRTPTGLFLVNISLSDLLVSFFGVSFTFLSCLRNGWAWDEAGCMWDGFSNSLFGKGGNRARGDSPPALAAPDVPLNSCRVTRARFGRTRIKKVNLCAGAEFSYYSAKLSSDAHWCKC